ncbi:MULTISPECIES: metallophosphoesterase [Pseudodesulfovibrio]|uniref:Metallophosphoesterase n=1 Tax=Pseudodesulfovibrio aespoeensis (strain ATCC 700646 / DSM 10631 / Aspo-2) TaxID=643562 RepID=E6VUZ1_PSEA9|nr:MULTISPECIES: metallophosphoesterase [Pseudodesulfovibrio]ADU63499.1 metallophosphoesterase [Pseudodesulfovibrio aespoeensis Aspo-2]MCG2731484.1 metallophosphoesterase [Pseudodesulfovibrio aespoeensis]
MAMWSYIVLAVATLLTLYLGWRMIMPLPVSRGRRFAAWLAVAALLYGQRLARSLRTDGAESMLFEGLNWVVFVFLGLVSMVVMFMLLRDLPILASRLATGVKCALSERARRVARRSAVRASCAPDMGRRRFVLNASNAAILAVSMPLTGYSIFEARRNPVVVQNDLSVPGLPPGLDGFTIAQISDTHIGPTLRGGWMRMVVDEVNALGADMVVHTGDMVDGSVSALRREVAPLAELKARHGVWLCTGNHEYYSGVEAWLEESARLGMRPLVDEHTLIDTGQGRILLAGVADYRAPIIHPAHASSPAAAMAAAPDHDVSILLAHQPMSIYEASRAGFDIQLSGHTHGGQFFPWTLAIHLFQPYVRGLHWHENTLLYVNTGTGYWGPPMRLGTAPEITLHTLRQIV